MNKLFVILFALTAAASAAAQDFVYLMPSKEIAETGEDLWFKAYLMDRRTMALSDRSQTLYLQIRTATDSVVWSEKYPLVGGRGNGHIYIGDEWPHGEYFMEGYAMSAFTADTAQALRPRRIMVLDRVSQMDSISTQAVLNDSIQKRSARHRFTLFPEGGNLIYNVSSVVAFKATYGDGFPEDVEGQVLEDDRPIAEIRCLHDGMGQFAITPQQGKEYTVRLSDGRTYDFPQIERNGLSLRVIRNNSDGISLLISAPDDASHAFSVSAKLHGITCCNASGAVSGQQVVRLPMEHFLFQGIAEITLSDGANRPVAERLVFVRPEQRLSLTAAPNHERYNCRDDGTVHLQVKDADGKPVRAELAVSILDKAYLYQPGHENILSHCYLAEQIRGSIFNPTYYFDEQNADRHAALDLLLLTQGWRRYVWSSEPLVGQPLLPDGIAGIETARRDRTKGLQFIQAFSPQGDTCLVVCDTLGRFEVAPDQMTIMPGRVYLKPMLKKPGGRLIIVDPFDTINAHRQSRLRYFPMNQIFETHRGERIIHSEEGTIDLNEFTVKAKSRVLFRDKVTGYLDSLAILSSGEWVCECQPDLPYLNDYHGYSHHPEGSPMADWYRQKGGKRLLPKRGASYELIKYEPANGRKGAGFADWIIIGYPMRGYIYPGPQYTEDQLLKMYGMWKSQGYYPKREFYEPDPLDRYSPTPDPRNLLQWRPAVMTDENGEAEIPFMASDINTEFVGVVEAIDGGGLLGCQTFSFRVIK